MEPRETRATFDRPPNDRCARAQVSSGVDGPRAAGDPGELSEQVRRQIRAMADREHVVELGELALDLFQPRLVGDGAQTAR